MNYTKFTKPEVVISNMVEISLNDGSEEGFRKVKETLQRVGIPSKRTKTIYQSAHILHKAGRYYICHFLELFALDGRSVILSEEDIARRNLIINYLIQWNLIEPLTNNWEHPMGSPRMVKVIKHSEKDEWTLEQKYSIGVKKT
jgi:hypothetical protein